LLFVLFDDVPKRFISNLLLYDRSDCARGVPEHLS